MDQLVIRGGKPLRGKISISGAKNAALPLMAASLLTEETLTLHNIPALDDMGTMSDLLVSLGATVDEVEGSNRGRTLKLTARPPLSTVAPYEIVNRIRASVLVLGPLLARTGEATVSMPGGDAIGIRPIDQHLKGLEAMGAKIELKGGNVIAHAPGGLKGATIRFPFVSVGATENLLMAAALAKGTTIMENAAREPEVTDLAQCLVAMGANIHGIGTECLVIQGVDALHAAEYTVMPDRIEAGTYAVAAAITGGELVLDGANVDHLGAVFESLAKAGVNISNGLGKVRVSHPTGRCRGFDVITHPFPGFPTDMQAQFMALMAVADGASLITETIFENRFMHAPELARMGADITVHGSSAMVRGNPRLRGAPVMATDLRASVCLVLAGMAAEGETVVNGVYHLDRGYEKLEEKLRAVGADIRRTQDDRAIVP
ncbi:UDP-N-acetylglucosamine 1-carboxyvinyltransferase [Iodidimonas sp. SYSU 1G8]|uniref:UDP-N-acetylglucosamine 1-carboxyvinyltransferase n=1 Tax=Iodidimonas sp. SYSU 1G8 TaxID=3133967 RepID=UPI0031FE7EB4